MPGTPEPINLSNTTPAAPAGSRNLDWQADSNVPRNVSVSVPIADVGVAGIVEPDNSTITVAAGVASTAGFTGTLAAAIAAGKNVKNGLIY